MYNSATLIGNLGQDPEIRATHNGSEIASFTLATSESWRDKASGERKSVTEWHRIVVFNEALVKLCKSYLKKGSKIWIQGQIKTRKWTDKDGADKYTTEIVLQNYGGTILMLDGKQEREPTTHDTAKQDGYAPQGSVELDDKIPF
jgi:single-strand DNA-binding protein